MCRRLPKPFGRTPILIAHLRGDIRLMLPPSAENVRQAERGRLPGRNRPFPAGGRKRNADQREAAVRPPSGRRGMERRDRQAEIRQTGTGTDGNFAGRSGRTTRRRRIDEHHRQSYRLSGFARGQHPVEYPADLRPERVHRKTPATISTARTRPPSNATWIWSC